MISDESIPSIADDMTGANAERAMRMEVYPLITNPGVACDCQWVMKENYWGSAVDSLLLLLCC